MKKLALLGLLVSALVMSRPILADFLREMNLEICDTPVQFVSKPHHPENRIDVIIDETRFWSLYNVKKQDIELEFNRLRDLFESMTCEEFDFLMIEGF